MITDKEIASLFQKDYTVINKKAKTHPHEYEIIRLGAICKKFNITEEKLNTLLEDDNLEKALKIIEIIKGE